ncbi:MAG: N-acetyl-gamma-glutamyl-phosphate reductase [Candidatus Omnitrophica bacterium]|nr:N-acetyl-gamma-glutamyl-phosphate reductase [Candidatus Omnitrophota bacterium]
MIKCAVVGATGYTGIELIKILLRHSDVELTKLTTRQTQAIPIHQLIPTLPADIQIEVRNHSVQEVCQAADVIFLCLPHTEAMEAASVYAKAGRTVIDLSADLRLHDWKTYEKWYGVKHIQKALLKKAIYGLPEIYRNDIRSADLIANPGCYPTAAILGLYPLLKKRLIDLDSIIIDAKSGVSGAGKKPNASTQFCELDENFYAYKVGRHQHTPEINQTLSEAAGAQVSVTLTTHLLPLDRGILATIYARRKKGVKESLIRDTFFGTYEGEPFIRIKPAGFFPSLKDVQKTNFCDIGIDVDSQSDRVIIITAIDNLLKGASGQAVQNMNIRFGLPETQGLQVW